jgi:subtilase family serine protease
LEDHVAGILGVFDLDDFPIDAELPEKLLSREIRELKREEAATPGSAKMRNQSLGAVPTSLLSVEDLLTPQKLRDTYKVPAIAEAGSPEQLARSSTSQAVFASLQQYWSPRDRLLFEAYFDLPRTQVDELDNEGTEEHTMASSDTKCRLNPNSCMEANLDVQYMLAMSPWSKMGLFYMSAQSHKNLFAEFVLALSEMKDPPRVVSISYGGPEVGRSADLIRAFNYVASKIAAQGVTILASSGDDGANGLGPFVKEGVTCRDILDSYGLVVNWPASSPWVTAVGATMGAESSMEEIACATNAKGPTADASPFSPSITSGGGFSQAIPRPRWQPEYKGQSGRGVPDVSLAGHAYAVVVGGKWTAVDGTSASAPAFAGMLSLVNAQLNLDRKEGDRVKSVGWLNPVLYRHKEAFTDVTEGNNFCARAGKPCCGGYDSGAGWDPVTGLGTVNGAVVARLMGVAP